MTELIKPFSLIDLASRKLGSTIMLRINERLVNIPMSADKRLSWQDFVKIPFKDLTLGFADEVSKEDKEEILTAILYLYRKNGWHVEYTPQYQNGNGDYLTFTPRYPDKFEFPCVTQ